MRILTGYVDRLVQAIGSFVASRKHPRMHVVNDADGIDEPATADEPVASVGTSALVRRADGSIVEGRVVAIGSGRLLALADTNRAAVSAGREDRSYLPLIGVSEKLLGRTVDCHASPVDGMGPVGGAVLVELVGAIDRAPMAVREPMEIAAAPGLFRGAKAVLRSRGPDALRHLCEIARAHRGPVVAAMIGGSQFEHSIFSADLLEAFYRTVLLSEPREMRPHRALRTFRAAATIASYLARAGDDPLLLVSWNLPAYPMGAESNAPHDVTSVWSIEGSVSGFDVEICPEGVREEAV
jgi:hypothetical protein